MSALVTHSQLARTLARNLAYAREGLGLTQQQAADRLGMKRARYAAWEEGRSTPAVAPLLACCSLYGETVDALLTTDLTR